MELNLTNLLGQLTITAITLGIAALGYSAWFASGIANAAIKTKTWSWRRTFTDLGKVALAVYVVFAVVIGFNLIKMVAAVIGFDISIFTESLSTAVVAGTALGGAGNFFVKAINNVWNLWKFKQVGAAEVSKDEDIDYTTVGNQALEFANKVTPWITANQEQTSIEAAFEAETVEVGQGSDVNPLTRRLPDGNNDNGKGWQCSKYSWYLASGEIMNYAPSPDFGPCNGNAMVDYLISKLGWVKCGKINGAIFSYNTGAYGHTGMVVDAANNMVNDANWSPLVVSTHYLNLDAVGAVYCCPKSMLEASKPVDEGDYEAGEKKDDQVIADEVIAGKWGNGDDRKSRLSAAGYNYDTIQAIVNGKLAPKTTPTTTKKAETFSVGDTVVPTKLVDYTGHALRQFDSSYVITQLDGNRAVLSARGQVWAAMNTNSIRKA